MPKSRKSTPVRGRDITLGNGNKEGITDPNLRVRKAGLAVPGEADRIRPVNCNSHDQ